jgi:CHAT domain-containing protein
MTLVSPKASTEFLPRIPDLEIAIRFDGTSLLFEVHASDPAAGLDSLEMRGMPLGMPPEKYLHSLFKDIENLLLDTPEAREIAEQKIAIKGLAIWKLFPRELQDLLWQWRGKALSLLIRSDEPHIPWEIAKLQSTGRDGRVTVGKFLCEAFAVTRWLRGHPYQMRLPLQSLALVIPKSSRLKGAAAEGEEIRRLAASHRRQVTDVEPTFLSLSRVLALGVHDSWHFAGHGAVIGDDVNRWAIQLDGLPYFTVEDLLGEAKNLGLSRPLVFLNGCTSGRGGFTLTGPGGWSRGFLDANAGAFIGTYWGIEDGKSREIALSFYKNLFNGLPVGEAFRKARRDLNKKYKGDPTWLAYTIFAHPLATCSDIIIEPNRSPDQRTRKPVRNSSQCSLRVFLCHASQDKPFARDLYNRLENEGLRPWLDEVDILPGEDWEYEIRNAVRSSDVVVVCLSQSSVSKSGFVQKEIVYALDVADEKPQGTIFIIPLKLEECKVPDRLRKVQWVDYFHKEGHDRLMRALHKRAQALLVSLQPQGSPPPEANKTLSPPPPTGPLQWSIHESSTARSQAEASPPDLTLYVLQRPGGRGLLFDLRLTARDPALNLRERSFGNFSLDADPAEFFRQRLKGDLSVEDLRTRGTFFAEQFLPPDLHQTLSGLRDRVAALQIVSDDPWIPWEILCLDEGLFFCEAFALTRWIHSIRQTGYLPLSHIAAVVPQGLDLLNAEQEWQDLQSLAGDGRQVERIPARRREIAAAFRTSSYDGWHYTGHGFFRINAPDLSSIYLEDREELTPADLAGDAKRMGKPRPFVFFNSSESSHWAPYFLRAGAGAFLGTLLPVRDSSSRSFARALYSGFIGGLNLAEAVREARRAIRSEEDATWLAYTVFGHPLAVCRGVPDTR